MLTFPLAIWESIEKVVVIVKLEVEGLLSRFLRWPVVWGKEIMVLIDVGKHLEHEFLISCSILQVVPEIDVRHCFLLFHLVNTDLQAFDERLSDHSDCWGRGTRSAFQLGNPGNEGRAFSHLLQEHAVA